MSSAKLKILLVEDEYLVAMLTEDMLSDLGFDVGAIAGTLEMGLKEAANGAYDAAVLDVNLRGQMSFPIADLLSEKGIPFVFASGYSAQAMDPRFDNVVRLQKPFSAEALERAMNEALSTDSREARYR